jgi:DNA-binding NarL/FixJ family response regulator
LPLFPACGLQKGLSGRIPSSSLVWHRIVQHNEEDCLHTIRILLVDDHELVRRTLCGMLNSQLDMAVVCQASSGLEAVRKAEEFQPDVVLLDIGLPELNGLNATPLIKHVAPKAEVLIVTQYEEEFFARQAFAAGARGFVTKAVASEKLIAAVRQAFGKKRPLADSPKTDALSKKEDPDGIPTR